MSDLRAFHTAELRQLLPQMLPRAVEGIRGSDHLVI
jgi:hypothetical protein